MEYEIIGGEVKPIPLSKSPETDTSPDAVMERAILHAEYLKLMRRSILLGERKQLRAVSKHKQKIKNRRRSTVAAQSRKHNR